MTCPLLVFKAFRNKSAPVVGRGGWGSGSVMLHNALRALVLPILRQSKWTSRLWHGSVRQRAMMQCCSPRLANDDQGEEPCCMLTASRQFGILPIAVTSGCAYV